MTVLNVPGIGTVQSFSITSDGINYEKVPATNNHNETGVNLTLDRNDLFNDDTNVSFSCTQKTCELDVTINSEVNIPLYNDGRLKFTFDIATQTWSMKAYRIDGLFFKDETEWNFCSPDATFGQTISALTFLKQDAEKDVQSAGENAAASFDYNDLLGRIAQSLMAGRTSAVSTAPIYKVREDCTAIPPRARPMPDFHGGKY